MDEYIKKNQALCCFSGWTDQFGDFHEPDEMVEYQRIEQLTAADVVPVRHGRWIRGGHKDRYYVCSCCGYKRYACFEKPSAEFCEDCGAKMDGKDGGND